MLTAYRTELRKKLRISDRDKSGERPILVVMNPLVSDSRAAVNNVNGNVGHLF
jgi:hypothetical protein